MQRFVAFGAMMVIAGIASAPAYAGTITETYSFSLGGLVDINGSPPLPPPVNTITGSFTVTFDPSQDYNDDTTDIVVHSFSGIGVPLDHPRMGFTYFGSGAYAGGFFFGGVENNSDFVRTGTNDFVVGYDLTDPSDPRFLLCNAPGIVCGAHTGDPAYAVAGYTRSGNNSLWFISVAQSDPAIPEPATWALLLAGFAGLGYVGYRKRPMAAGA